MVKPVEGWITVQQDAPTQFKIVFDRAMILRCACDHASRKGYIYFEPGCRPCDVNRAQYESGIKIDWHNDEVNLVRTIWGVAENDEQKIALARMVALARGDIDSMLLVEARSIGLPV